MPDAHRLAPARPDERRTAPAGPPPAAGARPDLELAAFDAGYRAPRRSLRPEGPFNTDPRWHEAADFIERTSRDPEIGFAVFYARQKRLTLAEARRAMETFWLSRTLTFD